MSFLKSLFGMGGNKGEAGSGPAATAKEAEHKGFIIRATPYKEGGQFQTAGMIVKEIGGELSDMVLLKEEGKYLVDCRHWTALEVGATAAGQLYGAMGRLDAKGGIVVTAGKFTPDALEFARGLNVELIAGRELAGMLEMAKETITGAVPVRSLAR